VSILWRYPVESAPLVMLSILQCMAYIPRHHEKEYAFKEPQDDQNVPHLERGFRQSFSGASSAKSPQSYRSCGLENLKEKKN